jgi:deoxyribodipyrimidine photo-lyase
MSSKTAIVWFRRDLRLADNPALHAAYENGYKILPVYILDDVNPGDWMMGAASRAWLHHSLKSLDNDLSGHLVLEKGDAKKIIPELVEKSGAQAVLWNRCYEPWRIDRDKVIKSDLEDKDIIVHSFNGSLLWEPWTIKNQSGDFYKVFTPFYKKGCLQADPPRDPVERPARLTYADGGNMGLQLDDLELLPDGEGDWDEKMLSHWTVGEDGAMKTLHDFLDDGLKGYKEGRDFPAQNNVSTLSPRLHWGEISPHQVWYEVQQRGTAEGWEKDRDNFCSELGWREFSYNLLYHYPKLKWDNIQEKFNDFPWRAQDSDNLDAWKRGKTGYPIVDAAMRQLWQEGWMHNRLRMVVASFLVKHLLIHWHRGEEWFWDCLVDADPGNNCASWQWVAGCGADAAPYFRIFNPILQSKKFDGKSEFIRRYVPELKDMPDDHIHAPWQAPDDVLKEAGVSLGKTYPKPLIEHEDARDRAMEAYKTIKSGD